MYSQIAVPESWKGSCYLKAVQSAETSISWLPQKINYWRRTDLTSMVCLGVSDLFHTFGVDVAKQINK